MKSRSKLRDIIVKILYQYYIYSDSNINVNIKDIIKENINYDDDFVYSSVKFIVNNKKDIEEIANKYLKNWTIDRLSKVDKAIISLAIYEMKYTDTPNIVCINEAVELAKTYSDEKVVKMINASLDSFYRDLEDNKA